MLIVRLVVITAHNLTFLLFRHSTCLAVIARHEGLLPSRGTLVGYAPDGLPLYTGQVRASCKWQAGELRALSTLVHFPHCFYSSCNAVVS